MDKLEREYQAALIKTLEELFPGCVILKNDPNYAQGMLDLVVFVGPRWGMLEVKRNAKAPFRPNQEYYISLFDKMGFASVIYPENEREVLRGLQQALRPGRPACLLEPFATGVA